MSGNCDGVLADALIGVSYFTNLTPHRRQGHAWSARRVPLAKGINIGKLPHLRSRKAPKGMVVGTRSDQPRHRASR